MIESHTPALFILAVSILTQLTAAVLALRLIRVTGKSYAWIFVSAAIVLMCCRRIIPLCHSVAEGKSYSCDLLNEAIGLAISLFILLGILGIGWIFIERNRAEHVLREFDRLKMSALQGKANPHFLFNTLNSIAYLIGEDKKKEAGEALHKLSDINRYLVDLADGELVSLEQGLTVLRDYFDLEQLRFGKGIALTVSTDGDIGRVFLPGLTLQPIVENSVKHGFSPRGGKGNVFITVTVKESTAQIVILDDGVGCDSTRLTQGRGIGIVKARLELCFGRRFSMEMSSEIGKGTMTSIIVPVKTVDT